MSALHVLDGGSNGLRKGMNVEPRHSLSRIRMLSTNKYEQVCSLLLIRSITDPG